MKRFIFSFAILLLSWMSFGQCTVIGTAMPQPATCAGSCDGQILYLYQNTGPAGAPYTVALEDGSGNLLSFQTYLSEMQTISFTNLCAGNYTITVQGTSCSFTATAFIAAPTPITVTANVTDPSPGMSDGSVTFLPTGGTAPYAFSLDCSTYQASSTFSGLSAGVYTGCVVDANGCTEMVSFMLSDVAACNVVVTANPMNMPLCAGSCSGAIQYAYFDGNSNNPYVIELIQGGVTLQTATNNSSSGSGSFTNLCAGVYSVQVTDAQGCTGSYTITLSEPSVLTVTSVNATNASAGMSNGSATINVSGGVPSYQYSLDGISYQSSNVFNNLAAGVYIAYVQDSNGCIVIYTFLIQEDPGCNFNTTTSVNQGSSCSGSCDAEILYVFSGIASDPPYTITLQSGGSVVQSATNPNQTVTGMFTGLCPGTYTLTVTNSSGCQEVSNVTVNAPAPLNYSYSGTAPTFGNSDGSIHVNVVGGTAPYEYSIDNMVTWQSSPDFSGLPSGFYIINIQDANGCMGIVCVVLTETTGCNFNITGLATSSSCASSCDGSITYTFNDAGNDPPYTIELMQGSTVAQTNTVTVGNGGSGVFSNLCEGVYTVQVTNGSGCTDEISLYVDAPDYLYVSGANVTDATAGNSDGSAEILVNGGTAPYQFSLDNGATWSGSNVLTGLSADFYILTVMDANGCTAIFCFIVNEDPGCTIATTLFLDTPVSCHGACDGALDYAYSEGISNPPYTIVLANNGITVNTSTQTNSAFSGTFTGLCAGNYSITVTNGSGCQSFTSNYTLTDPAAVSLNVTVTDASTGSANGVAVVNASGGTGQYLYSLDAGMTWQPSNVFNNLAPGTYIAYVQDENGCMNWFTFIVGENANCNIVLTVFSGDQISCSGSCDASINFAYSDASSNPPYTAILTNTWGGTSSQTFSANNGTGEFTNLCAGTYTVSVQDAMGCVSIQTFVVTAPDYLNVGVSTQDATAGNSDGSAVINVTGGTAPYQFSMDNQATWQSSNSFDNLGAGVYILYVQDANGCMQIFCFILGDSNVLGLTSVDGSVKVYPNPMKDRTFVQGQGLSSVIVYDLNGQQIPVGSITTANGIVLNLENTASGVYLLEILKSDGTVIRSRVIQE